MEEWEAERLRTALLKPNCWFRYVDDMFVIWPHGTDTLEDFLNDLTTIHLTMELEVEEKKLLLLDVLVIIIKCLEVETPPLTRKAIERSGKNTHISRR